MTSGAARSPSSRRDARLVERQGRGGGRHEPALGRADAAGRLRHDRVGPRGRPERGARERRGQDALDGRAAAARARCAGAGSRSTSRIPARATRRAGGSQVSGRASSGRCSTGPWRSGNPALRPLPGLAAAACRARGRGGLGGALLAVRSRRARGPRVRRPAQPRARVRAPGAPPTRRSGAAPGEERRRGDGRRRVRPFGEPRDGAPGAGGPTAHRGHRASLAEGYATAMAEPHAERVRRTRSLQVGHHVAVVPPTVPHRSLERRRIDDGRARVPLEPLPNWCRRAGS